MASPCRAKTCLQHGMQVSITVAFIFSLTVLLLPTKSERDIEGESKEVIGSKRPSCVNKCMKCRPCLVTLVAPDHHQRKKNNKKVLFKVWSRGEDDDPYYLLSWKCTCKDKLFPP